jgi:uncharacterized protein
MGAGAGLYATWLARRRLEVVEADVTLPHLPAALDGIVVAMVADIHRTRYWGKHRGPPVLQRAIETVRGAKPDIFVACGDYGFRKWRPQEVAGDVAAFEAPVRVAVLGNHDYGQGELAAVNLRCALERRGVTVLKNQARAFDVRGSEIWIGGLDDGASGRANPRAMLDCVPTNGAAPRVSILLSHSPDAVARMPPGSFDLALSGHTHGGQIALPFVNPTLLRKWARTCFDRGLYGVHGGTLFVTKGLGTVGYHARFRARPEVVFLRLCSAPVSKHPIHQLLSPDQWLSSAANSPSQETT